MTTNDPFTQAIFNIVKVAVAEAIRENQAEQQIKNKQYAYGIAGIAQIFGCSKSTAQKIKNSGKIDRAITQVGRKITVDVELARQLRFS